MGTLLSFFASLGLLSLLPLHPNWAAADIGIGGGGEITIGIGGGGGSGSPPASPSPCDCHPSPPLPLVFESKRLEIVYPVIQRFKSRIKYDPLGITKTWVGSDICNKYKGFNCDLMPNQNATALAGVDFNGFLFGGPELVLTGFLDQLPDIAIFHANSNNFTGAIPQGINRLQYLYELDLSNNKYSGEFPTQVIGKGLTFLDLRFNSFSGTVPPQIFAPGQLDVIFINNNGFHAQSLPESIGLTEARYLTFANNMFTGPIPRSIGLASETLREVLFLNNYLSGCLPAEIGLLGRATVFDAGQNQLTGPIPHSFGCLEKMQVLNLAENQLYGTVPEEVCSLSNLMNLSLSWNYFTQVDPACKKLIEKGVLYVSKNCIPGLSDQRSPSECEQFLCKPKLCPLPTSNSNNLPCTKGHLNTMKKNAERPASAAASSPPSPVTYAALVPNRP